MRTRRILRHTLFALFGMAAIGGGAMAIDYHHARNQKQAATTSKKAYCGASYYAFGPWRSVRGNYMAIATNILGPEATKTVATSIKGPLKGNWAYYWAGKRADMIAKCYDLPVSGYLLHLVKRAPMAAPAGPEPQ